MQSKKITKVQNQGPNDQLISQPGSKLGIDGLVGNVARDPASAGASPELTILRKKKGQTDLDESEIFSAADLGESVAPYSEQSILVAQLEGAGALGAGTASGAGVTATSTSLAAGAGAGAAGAAAGAASTTIAATSVSALTTATVTTTIVSAPMTALGVGGAAAAGGGGGGGATAASTASSSDTTTSGSGGSGGDPVQPLNLSDPAVAGSAIPFERQSVAGTTLPTKILNKSLVIDIGATFGDLYQQYFYTTQDGTNPEQTTIGTYSSMVDVTGTNVADQITGSAANNILDGGAGNDLIYGAGGRDTLRGSTGNDWVLFSPVTRFGGAGPYDAGVQVNLTTNLYISELGEDVASDFENALGSGGNDTITGTTSGNILVGGGGDDRLYGVDGADTLFGSSASTRGDQLYGQQGNDTFMVGYDFDPVAKSINPSSSTAGLSLARGLAVIRDWGDASGAVGERDVLTVSSVGTAVIGGLYGIDNWNTSNTIDLRTNVTNDGQIVLAAGAASNRLFLSVGNDVIFSGYHFVDASGFMNGNASPDLSSPAVDLIWEWDDQGGTRDSLRVASGSVAVISGLLSKSSSDTFYAADWSASDLVDLRASTTSAGYNYIENAGVVKVSTGAGSNIVYGSAGVDHIYGSSLAGNQVWGGTGADIFYVGQRYSADQDLFGVSPDTNTGLVLDPSIDIIWDWDGAADSLNVYASSTAIIAGLPNTTTREGTETVDLLDRVTNSGKIILFGGALRDVLKGSLGVDEIYGGSVGLTDAGNQTWGRDGADIFYVGYNYDPLSDVFTAGTGRSDLAFGELGRDVIRDFQSVDVLNVGLRGEAVIGGLYNQDNWLSNNSIDLRASTNLGLIKLAQGAGFNKVYGSGGTDIFYVGYEYGVAADSVLDGYAAPTASGAASDVIWEWDDEGATRDTLNVAAGSRAIIGGLLGVSYTSGLANWSGNNTVDLRSQVTNLGTIQVAAGSGANTIYLSDGNDEIYVGYESDTNNASHSGLLNAASAATDTVYGWNARTWNATSGTTWHGSTNSADTTYDTLQVRNGSLAYIGSLSGMTNPADSTRWDGTQIVDLRSEVTNSGEILVWTGSGDDVVYGSSGIDLIYAGTGTNNLWGGAGADTFYVGFAPTVNPATASPSIDFIRDWQNLTDSMQVAAGSIAVISGLSTHANTELSTRWDGDDVLDLSTVTVNQGKVIVATGKGTDTVTGSVGEDWIFAGSGDKLFNLGDVDNSAAGDGQDRIYIDSFLGRFNVTGFDSNDKIYLDQRIIKSFQQSQGITTVAGNYLNSVYTSELKFADEITSAVRYNNGDYALTRVTYDTAYNDALGDYGYPGRDPDDGSSFMSFGTYSNGVWSNSAHESAHTLSRIATIGAGTGQIMAGNALAATLILIPLAIPFWVSGALMFDDVIYELTAHKNAEYRGVSLDAGMNVLSSSVAPASTVGTWQTHRFLDFYNANAADKFTPSLEFTSHPFYSGSDPRGVASFVSVYNGTESFVYLVFSKDGIIQNNETRLIAQVNGYVAPNQFVLFDGTSTVGDADYLYYNGLFASSDVPTFPAGISAINITGNTGITVLTNGSATSTDSTGLKPNLTSDNTPFVTIQFAQALGVSDTLVVTLTNSSGTTTVSAENITLASDRLSATFTMSAQPDGQVVVGVQITSAQDFETSESKNVIIDTLAPALTGNNGDVVSVTSSELGLNIYSPEIGAYRFVGASGTANTDWVDLTTTNNRSSTFLVSGLSTSSTYLYDTIEVRDLLGSTSTITDRNIYVGSDTDNTVNLNGSEQNFIFARGGNDTITGGTARDEIYAGSGNDLIYSNGGGDLIVAGTGEDTIVLAGGSVSDTLFFSTDVGVANSSDTYGVVKNFDIVAGFEAGTDVIQIIGSNVGAFNHATDSSFVDGNTDGNTTLNEIGTITFSGGATNTSININFQSNYPGTSESGFSLAHFQAALQYSLTGTSDNNIMNGGTLADRLDGGAGRDDLNGGAGNDTLIGGLGADTLTGGTGSDKFQFAAGDSTPIISAGVVSGFDVVADFTLLDASAGTTDHDSFTLPPAFILANTSGVNGTDYGDLKSHSVTNGLLRFDDADIFDAAMTLNSDHLDDAVGYLVANVTGNGQIVGFNVGSDGYLFQNNDTGGDLFIKLQSSFISGLTLDPNSLNTGYVLLV